jgi:hypothetical protein
MKVSPAAQPDVVVADTPRVRILVIAAERARCFDVDGAGLVEVHGHGFPLQFSPARRDETPHRDFPLSERERAERHLAVVRAVDDALRPLQHEDPRPFIVIGPVRDVAYFDEVTSHGADIVDRVHGSHIDDSPSELTVLLAPALAAEGERRAAEAVRRANDAIGGRATVGFTDIAVAAAEGRGHELIVEAGLTAETAGADADPAAIDAVIDAVLEHNGNVMVVAPGSLREHGGMVLLLRY